MIESTFTITPGKTYVYVGTDNRYKGHLYRVHRHVIDVPVYDTKVLVEPLTGPDAGQWFVVSPANFAMRYELAEEPAAVTLGLVALVPESPADTGDKPLTEYW